jgi:hypothetical protein
MTAYAYIQQDAFPVAALYFDLIIKNYPDLLVRGESVHFIALNQLITLVKNQEQLVWYYEELISRFPDKIDPGVTYFMLGQAYERTGEWNGAIRAALDSANSARLLLYRAKVNFFARSWEQEDEDNAGMAEFNLSDFMRGNRIRYAPELDANSNASEAYLRTWGWSQYISTWYFYFRKIYFPPDPEIHGRWEWAGVYYGEKF